MGRDAEIEAIAELGRRTRTPTPRWLWAVALVVGVICVVGFGAMLLGAREPREPPSPRPGPRVTGRPEGAGLGAGLVIGAGAGIVIGFAIGRQRRSHSSRRSP